MVQYQIGIVTFIYCTFQKSELVRSDFKQDRYNIFTFLMYVHFKNLPSEECFTSSTLFGS